MKISYNWLNEYVDLKNVSAQELAKKLTLHVAEVEGITDIGKGFSKILVGEVLEVKSHPSADKLKIVKVNLGENKPELVCGAPNVKEGMFVAVGLEGITLPDGTHIKKAKIRGVESCGMILSEKELGISDDHSEIMVLPQTTKAGQTLDNVLGDGDSILTVENKTITHRPDLWGHWGFARELATLLGKRIAKYPCEPYKDSDKAKIDSRLAIEIDNYELCPRYSGLVIGDIEIKPSPLNIQRKLEYCGIRPVNNVVDATNYVLMELGQPTHAFDFDKISKQKIIVRSAKKHEKFTTLDGQERELQNDDILICDGEKVVAIGGVMGGLHSEVSSTTKNILIESATFHPIAIRKTAGRLGLRTEAAMRFEKSLDPSMTTIAIKRILQILEEGGTKFKIKSKLVDVYKKLPEEKTISLDIVKTQKRLGVNITENEIISILTRLNFETQKKNNSIYNVRVPSYRATKDISIEEDLIEEIGRIHGYINISSVAPCIPMVPVERDEMVEFIRRVKKIFSLSLGVVEVQSYSFGDARDVENFGFNEKHFVYLKNPINANNPFLRLSLVPSLAAIAARNVTNYSDFDIYEIGRIYEAVHKTEEGLPNESEILCAMFTKQKNIKTNESQKIFFEAKGYLERFLANLHINNVLYTGNADKSYLHPSRNCKVYLNKEEIGYIGQIHPAVAKKVGLEGYTSVFEINLNTLIKYSKDYSKFKGIPKFPGVTLDLSVVCDKRTLSSGIRDIIAHTDTDLIENVAIVAVFESEQLGKDKKSVTFRASVQPKDQTLSDDKIQALQNEIISRLKKQGFSLR